MRADESRVSTSSAMAYKSASEIGLRLRAGPDNLWYDPECRDSSGLFDDDGVAESHPQVAHGFVDTDVEGIGQLDDLPPEIEEDR